MKKIMKNIKPFIFKHEPEILITMGISGLIFATIWGIKATSTAKDIIRDEEIKRAKELHDNYDDTSLIDPLTKKEIFKLIWKQYVPVVVATAVSIPCIIASSNVYTKRNMALAAAYSLSETALTEYKEKTKLLVGEKKEKEITEMISQDKVTKSNSNSVILTGSGESLFYEPISGRYFKSSWNRILKAANEINAQAITDPFGNVTLTEWYNSIGLDGTGMSDRLGWELLDGKAGLIDISLNSTITPDDEPCGAIYYNTQPKSL